MRGRHLCLRVALCVACCCVVDSKGGQRGCTLECARMLLAWPALEMACPCVRHGGTFWFCTGRLLRCCCSAQHFTLLVCLTFRITTPQRFPACTLSCMHACCVQEPGPARFELACCQEVSTATHGQREG